MTTPVLVVRSDDTVGGDIWQPQTSSRGQCLVAPPAGPQLSVEVLGAAEMGCTFQKVDTARDQDQSIAVLGQRV
jgi:hypothetical protein